MKLQIDSAGTHAYHMGEPPDKRAMLAARERGIDISQHLSRVMTRVGFDTFDYILAMDKENLNHLRDMQPPDNRTEVHLLLEFAEACPVAEVPDPYFGGPKGFAQVLDLTEQGSRGLLRYICQTQGITPENL